MLVDTHGVAGITTDEAVLRGDTILGVTSFGLNANCAGIGGVYRIDEAGDLAFIDPLG